jgi:tetratricopeptide (TPR) repeat protein
MRRNKAPRLVVWAVLAWLVCLAGGAAAEGDPAAAAQAKTQFEEGRAAAKKGELSRARELFLSSHALVPKTGTLLNLADCEEKLGLYASAWQHLDEALRLAPSNDDRIPLLKERIAALLPRVPRLRVDVAKAAPPGSRVVLDGRELSPSVLGTDLPLDPGEHKLAVTAPGRDERTFTATLVEKQQLTIEVAPAEPRLAAPASSGTAPAVRAPRPPVPPPGRSRDPGMTAGFVIGGAGLLGLGAGAVLGGLALQQKGKLAEACPQGPCDAGVRIANQGDTFADASTVSFIAGGALVAAGGVLLIVRRGAATATATAVVTPAGSALVVRGSF